MEGFKERLLNTSKQDIKYCRVSIIIPCKKIDEYAEECIRCCLELDYPEFEVIVLPDHESKKSFNNVKIIPTGPVTPGAKRNIGMTVSSGEICAFIDSDAYPPKDWLKNAVKYLNEEVAAVGGPAITPPGDSLMQRASGYAYAAASLFSNIIGRFKKGKARESDDIHSCNFIAYKRIIKEVGGWNEKYWPGEDTLLCLAIKRRGYKMLEAPDVVVYHHRKPLFRKHLKQVSQFALHRGFFIKKYKGNSLKITYMIPTIITILLLISIPAIMLIGGGMLGKFFMLIPSLYLSITLLATILETEERKLIPIVWLGVILTHVTYGIYFVAGLLKKELKR